MLKLKIVGESDLADICAWRKKRKQIIVFTNGVFDILHAGHVNYLEQARSGESSILIVGVNSDEYVAQLKGTHRPVNPLQARMEVLAALASVSYVVPMRSNRNVTLMQLIKPDIWAKGGDYTIESLDLSERQTAASVGAKVKIIPIVHYVSTTAIIEKMKIKVD